MAENLNRHFSKEDMGFPCSSVGKEPACNAGDLSSIPGLGAKEIQSSLRQKSTQLGTQSLAAHPVGTREGTHPFLLFLKCPEQPEKPDTS